MATVEAQQPEGLEAFNLPPAAEPSSPLDDHDNPVPSTMDAHLEFYAPQPPQYQPQSQVHQPLLQSRNPFGENAETASIAPSVGTPQLPSYAASTPKNARYGVHRNEEEYLAALRAWVEEKQYVQLDRRGGLHGFYGDEELKSRAERMKQERRVEKEMKMRRKMERRGTVGAPEREQVVPSGGKRRASMANFFRRQSAAT